MLVLGAAGEGDEKAAAADPVGMIIGGSEASRFRAAKGRPGSVGIRSLACCWGAAGAERARNGSEDCLDRRGPTSSTPARGGSLAVIGRGAVSGSSSGSASITVTTSTSTTSTGGSSSSYSSATAGSLFGSAALALAAFGSGAAGESWSMTILGSGGGASAGSPDEYLSHCLPSK